MSYIHIYKTKPFYNAGHIYQWDPPVGGFGIELSILESKDDDVIVLHYRPQSKSERIYQITVKDAKNVIDKYLSHHQLGDLTLGIVPFFAFKQNITKEKENLVLFN